MEGKSRIGNWIQKHMLFCFAFFFHPAICFMYDFEYYYVRRLKRDITLVNQSIMPWNSITLYGFKGIRIYLSDICLFPSRSRLMQRLPNVRRTMNSNLSLALFLSSTLFITLFPVPIFPFVIVIVRSILVSLPRCCY